MYGAILSYGEYIEVIEPEHILGKMNIEFLAAQKGYIYRKLLVKDELWAALSFGKQWTMPSMRQQYLVKMV